MNRALAKKVLSSKLRLFDAVADDLGMTKAGPLLAGLYQSAMAGKETSMALLELIDEIRNDQWPALEVMQDIVRNKVVDAVDELMDGTVYVLANESMQGVYKVGLTTRNPRQRAKELSSATGVPCKFDVIYESRVYKAAEVERAAHCELADYRVSAGREFFRAEPEQIVAAIDAQATAIWNRDIKPDLDGVADVCVDWEYETGYFLQARLPGCRKYAQDNGLKYLWGRQRPVFDGGDA